MTEKHGEIATKAAYFAAGAHKGIGHKRRYTNKCYFDTHVSEVARTIYMMENSTEEMVALAYLHDVVEDTHVTIDMLRSLFPHILVGYVSILTKDMGAYGVGLPNRFEIAKIEAERINSSIDPYVTATVKYADILSNLSDVYEKDVSFAKTYVKEKEIMIDIMDKGDQYLKRMCYLLIDEINEKIREGTKE